MIDGLIFLDCWLNECQIWVGGHGGWEMDVVDGVCEMLETVMALEPCCTMNFNEFGSLLSKMSPTKRFLHPRKDINPFLFEPDIYYLYKISIKNLNYQRILI